MIQSLLIANRGEIACRIIRTARAMGVRTVAVYSEADAQALHVRQADDAVHIGPSPAAESYLRGDKIIAAAKETGAEAIHPGYGFLSENAEFARAVIAAGLIWVGPKPESIEAMGLKDAAKQLMRAAGVPVTPGYDGADQSPETLKSEADAIGYPVLIKAVAGGGGKGMRKVDAPEDFLAALESCKREANSSFANSDVLLEKWITSPRHIEVQVFGDTHGNVVHLFERDCSLQRRHQKVIEEAPAPGMDEVTREAICGAAVRAAKAVDYVGAGTIEFIADASEGLRGDRIYFMEMNTRLQVEHPVTEAITGQDLVKWQLLVASGDALPLAQGDLRIEGHAVEARLYAEDPARGFLPSTGTLEVFDLPRNESSRIDTGVEQGGEISPFYDPMIAKLIHHAPTRDKALLGVFQMADAAQVWPVRTNAGFLQRALLHPDFLAGGVTTAFLEQHLEELLPDRAPHPNLWRTAAHRMAERWNPKAELAGFRLNAPNAAKLALSHDGVTQEVVLDGPRALSSPVWRGDTLVEFLFGDGYAFELPGRHTGDAGHTADGAILAPMPGKVIAVDVAEGEAVLKGQRLLVLEAMKMEHALTAPFDGTVAELKAQAGAQVQVEALLARVERTDP